MRPLLHPCLVNGRFGDAAVYVETLFEKHAMLFDLGDINALPSRKILHVEHVFVSHAHLDHFFGFDRLLRILVGREKTVRLYGPPGFIERVHHKLQAYQWNLVDRYACDLIFLVTEIDPSHDLHTACLRLKNAFACEDLGHGHAAGAFIYSGPAFHVSAALLEHRIPSLAYAIEEATHVNVWKNRLAAMGLSIGPWLRTLKRAIIEARPDDHRIRVARVRAGAEIEMPLGALREVVTVTPGQKIAYVTDCADTIANREAIGRLARDADILFIEATFAAADAALAHERAHLTTIAAGQIARQARVRRVEPFHFSTRYEGLEEQLIAEVRAGYAGKGLAGRDALANGAPAR